MEDRDGAHTMGGVLNVAIHDGLWFEELLVPQGDERIQRLLPPGGRDGGGERNEYQEERRQGEVHDVERRQAKKEFVQAGQRRQHVTLEHA